MDQLRMGISHKHGPYVLSSPVELLPLMGVCLSVLRVIQIKFGQSDLRGRKEVYVGRRELGMDNCDMEEEDEV
jgi:hypothetical protein